MMHPDRMPSISLGLIVPVGVVYDGHHHWPNKAGVMHASVQFDARRLLLRPHPRPAGRGCRSGTTAASTG